MSECGQKSMKGGRLERRGHEVNCETEVAYTVREEVGGSRYAVVGTVARGRS